MEDITSQSVVVEAAPTEVSRRRTKGGAASKGGKSNLCRRFTPEQKREALEALQKSGMSKGDFSRTWGVSKSSLIKWGQDYAAGGPKALEKRSRGLKKGKGRKHVAVRKAVREAKKANPWFGLQKVKDQLFRFKGLKVSTGAIRRELQEAGLASERPPKRRKKSSDKIRRFERAKPGALWQSDITEFTLPRSGQKVYLTVFLDDHSRFVVSWKLALKHTSEFVSECLLAGIEKYGKPVEVLTDQGRQYFAWRGKSGFQKLLDRNDIVHVVARSHHPQTVGKCERLWKTVKEELWFRVKPQGMDEAKARLGHFFQHYNFQRPHQGLDGMVPADRFFGAGSEIRQVLEEELERNELHLALNEELRQSAYLVGRIGDQSVSLHGQKGQLVLTLPDGSEKTIETHDLGMPQEKKEMKDGYGSQGSAEGSRSGSQDETSAEESAVCDAQEGALAGEGAVGCGDGGGAQEGARDFGGAPADVAGQKEPCGGGFKSGCAGIASVADEPAGFGGDGGGAFEAAQGQAEEGGTCRWPRDDGAQGKGDEAGEAADER